MSKIVRDLPETIETRYEALGLAKNKRDSLPPTVNNPLTTATNAKQGCFFLCALCAKRCALCGKKILNKP